jgi:hypothetical protein
MKIIMNEKTVQRNKKIGQITTIGSLAILGVGLYLSFTQQLLTWSFGCLVAGFLISQIGIHYQSRWGRSPRVDELVTKELKGLEDKYYLYHYTTAIPHLLVGPAGIWMIMPFFPGGKITYNEQKKRWEQKGGNAYMKIFGQDSLGRPDLDAQSYMRDLQKYLKKRLPDTEIPPIKTAFLFTNPKVEVQAQNAPIPTMATDKLKDQIRRTAKQEPANLEVINLIQKNLPQP